MSENTMLTEYPTSRIRLLLLSRVIIISFLLALTAFIEIKGMGSL
ncbi:MAG: hypothetical protein ACD_87C00304G0004, partial [uncultured bacterium]